MEAAASRREGLAELFLWWYGHHQLVLNWIKRGWDLAGGSVWTGSVGELPAQITEKQWRTRWFPKGDLTQPVDDAMRHRFGQLLRENIHSTQELSAQLASMPTWEKLALLILLDQVPRNIHRQKPQSYAFDDRGRLIALHFMQCDLIHQLPFHLQATVLIALCHSENSSHQALLEQHLQSDWFQERYGSGTTHEDLSKALFAISAKHHERIVLFGRFPERNEILHRTSTPEEMAYLSQLR